MRVSAQLCFPAIEISLRRFQTLKALSFQWCLLGMAHPGFNFAFAIRIFNATRQGDRTVMGQHITIERIERRVVDIRLEHSFAQIVEHDDTHAATQTTKSFLVEFGPDATTGTEGEESHALAAVAKRHDKQTGASILAALRIAHPGTSAVIHLRFFTRFGNDHGTRLRLQLVGCSLLTKRLTL